MATFDYDLGILGGGSAGLTAAAGAARFGAKVLLIEREDRLGGDCLHYGCVPSKTLIKTASVYHHMKQSQRFGLPRVEAPPVDFRDVSGRIKAVISEIQKHDSPERFCRLGAQVSFGQAEFIDEHAVRLNGKIVSARTWMIATGSSPSVPPIPGLDRTPHLTNREIFYLNALPSSLIVLGAGPVAIEMAQAFSRLGTAVTVLQRSGQILTREDRDMADAVTAVLRSEGVTVMLDAAVREVRDTGRSREVSIDQKDGSQTTLSAEQILVALGRSANLGGLGLEKTGVGFSREGLLLDARLRSTQRHIFGAGDVTGSYQFTHAAGYEAGIVVANAILRLPRKADYTLMPWCTYTSPELASIGMNETAAKKAGIDCTVWTEEFRSNDRGLAEGEPGGKIKLVLDRKERPIGVQILGIHAGELISEWVAAMNGGVKLSSIASAVHPYPTLAEINKRVVGDFFSGKIFSDTVKKTLKLFFNLRGRACSGEAVEQEKDTD